MKNCFICCTLFYLSRELREAPDGGGLLEDLLGGEPGRESAAGGQHGDDGDEVGVKVHNTRNAVSAWFSCLAKRRSKQQELWWPN